MARHGAGTRRERAWVGRGEVKGGWWGCIATSSFVLLIFYIPKVLEIGWWWVANCKVVGGSGSPVCGATSSSLLLLTPQRG